MPEEINVFKALLDQEIYNQQYLVEGLVYKKAHGQATDSDIELAKAELVGLKRAADLAEEEL